MEAAKDWGGGRWRESRRLTKKVGSQAKLINIWKTNDGGRASTVAGVLLILGPPSHIFITYTAATLRMAATANLVRRFMFRFQTRKIGNVPRVKSEIELSPL